jgi:integral membrane sensor domain MASE1
VIIPQETPSAPISSAAAIRAGKILAPLWGRVVLFGALYLIGAGVGRYLSPPEFPFVTFWLPSGLYVATLLRQQTRHWAAFVAAAVVANLAFDLVNGQVPPTALLFAIANSAEALTGAWLVRRLVAPSPDLSKVREVVGVIGWSALASTTLSATIGAGTVAFINGNGSFGQTWLLWWSGDVTGIVLLATSILGWRKDIRWWLAWPPTRRQAEAGAAVALAFLACFFLLFDPWHRDLPLKYGTIPIVLFVNYRYGPRASWLIVLLVALLATWLTAHGFSDIARGGLPQRVQVTALQLFLAVVALTALLQSALLAEWRRDAQRIRDQAQILAHIGDTVTATDLEGRILYVNDAQCRTLQRTPEELLGQSVEVFGDDPLRGATQR